MARGKEKYRTIDTSRSTESSAAPKELRRRLAVPSIDPSGALSEEPLSPSSALSCGCASHREYIYIDETYFMTQNYLYSLLFNHNTEIRSVFLKQKGCQGKSASILL
jgi:hypothetical protein